MSMDNEYDAFSQGIEPGGLRSRTQIKILAAFILSRVGSPMKSSMIIESLQLHGLANYFEASQALEELIENGNLSRDGDLIYITPKGSLSADELSRDLPKSVKETALADALKLKLLQKRESENSVGIIKTENGLYVEIKVVHKGEPLMELKLYAADEEQARELKGNFLKDPSRVYAAVAASLFV